MLNLLIESVPNISVSSNVILLKKTLTEVFGAELVSRFRLDLTSFL